MRLPGRLILACALAGLAGVGAAADAGQYVGPGACASRNCHGSVAKRADSRVSLQNEYTTWHSRDRHARSWRVLLEERSLEMSRRLGMREAPSRADRCLECHAPDVPDTENGSWVAYGVSCEACHGPAGKWLNQHTREGWQRSLSIRAGMIDTGDPAIAASVCLGCHLGNERRTVDHEMIAAGHPRLT